MNVSYLMISYNRCRGLLANLAAVYRNRPEADVWVVDNASTDGTSDAVRSAFPRVRLIQLDSNVGMPARNAALLRMQSEYAVLLDDDSHPIDDAIDWSTAYMHEHRDVAAVVGRVVLPNGRVEAPALPTVLLGGASCVRLKALREVGFFPHDFFRQAEEYDLSLRLWNAGHRVVRFEDVIYRHDKSPGAGRASSVVASLDLKHNLIVAARHLPRPFDEIYRDDFSQRYRAIMTAAGHGDAYEATVEEAGRYVFDARRLQRQPMSHAAFENAFEHRHQQQAIARWADRNGIRRVAIADVSKNLFATYQACHSLGLRITAIVDDRSAFAGMDYRTIPVKPAADIDLGGVDGFVVSNTNPAQIDAVVDSIGSRFARPLLRLWQPRYVMPREPAEAVAA